MSTVVNIEKNYTKTWNLSQLRKWQIKAVEKIFSQNERQILFITDPIGSNGKSFFAKLLRIAYNFQIVEGSISHHYLVGFIRTDSSGVVMDMKGTGVLNYTTVEAIKDGTMTSGK